MEDFKRIAHDVGFADPRTLSTAPIEVTDAELKEVTGEARFWSITYRCAPPMPAAVTIRRVSFTRSAGGARTVSAWWWTRVRCGRRGCRLFKLPGALETLCEDYGQVATYKGTIPGHTHAYDLDDHHRFVAGKPMLVCGNSAAMVGDSWLAKHFDVQGDRSVHYGLFDCADPVAPAVPAAGAAAGGCC